MRFFVCFSAILLAASASGEAPAQYDSAFPQWSPDERHIVFASTRDGDFEIYTMSADGTDPRRLTSSTGRDAHPSYWPGHNRIVFQSPRGHSDERDVELYTMNRDGTDQRPLYSAAGFNGVPVPSRDGKRIAFQRGIFDSAANDFHWELFLIDADGKNERQLTKNSWSSQVPTWMPGDHEIVFYANPRGTDQLFLMNVDTGRVRQFLQSSTNDRAPSLSRDGRFLAFHSDRGGGDGDDLYVLDRSTNAVTRLTSGLSVRCQPGWTRDGRRIVFSGNGTGVDEVYVVGRDGKGLTRLTRGTEGTR